MTILQQYISVIGVFQGCLLFMLLVRDPRVSSASRILSIICLILALLFFLPFIMTNEALSPLSWAVGWIFYLPASLGGLTYIYCRNSILDRSLTIRDFVHLVPLFICYALAADFLLFAPDELSVWIQGGDPQSWRLALSEYVIFAQGFFYVGITAVLIRRCQRQANDRLANFNPAVFRWLWGFVLFLVPIWCLKAVVALINGVPIAIFYISDILIVMLFYFIAMAQWRNPQLFTVHQLPEEQPAVEEESAAGPPKEPRGALDVDTRAQLLASVKQQVEDRDLYRDSELTLASLAEETGLSSHHLSEVLNQHDGKNFYQFINAYRISYVRQKLEEDSTRKILDIAMDAGFSSKSTFNSIFKQFTNATPSQYRKALASENV